MKASKFFPVLLSASLAFVVSSYGDSFNSVTVTNGISAGTNIVSTGGDINANNGKVFAGTFVRATTYIQAYQNLLVGNGALNSGSVMNAAAIGDAATASSYSSLVIGRYNVIEGTAGSWNATAGALEPLLVVGNGANASTRNNAFTVYKDGTVTMSKAQGDILMGQFGN